MNSHFLPQPDIVCGSTRYLLSGARHTQWPTELTELSIVVMEQEFGLLLKAGVADLLFRPLKRRMTGDVHVDHLSTRKLHDQEDIENAKTDCVLHKEVAAPNDLGLVLQEASPGLGIYRPRRSLDHVSSDRGAGVANAELQFQLQGNAILSVLGVIRRYPPDEIDVFTWD